MSHVGLTSLKKHAVNEAYQLDSNLGVSTADHQIEDAAATTEGEVTTKKTTEKTKSPKKKLK